MKTSIGAGSRVSKRTTEKVRDRRKTRKDAAPPATHEQPADAVRLDLILLPPPEGEVRIPKLNEATLKHLCDHKDIIRDLWSAEQSRAELQALVNPATGAFLPYAIVSKMFDDPRSIGMNKHFLVHQLTERVESKAASITKTLLYHAMCVIQSRYGETETNCNSHRCTLCHQAIPQYMPTHQRSSTYGMTWHRSCEEGMIWLPFRNAYNLSIEQLKFMRPTYRSPIENPEGRIAV